MMTVVDNICMDLLDDLMAEDLTIELTNGVGGLRTGSRYWDSSDTLPKAAITVMSVLRGRVGAPFLEPISPYVTQELFTALWPVFKAILEIETTNPVPVMLDTGWVILNGTPDQTPQEELQYRAILAVLEHTVFLNVGGSDTCIMFKEGAAWTETPVSEIYDNNGSFLLVNYTAIKDVILVCDDISAQIDGGTKNISSDAASYVERNRPSCEEGGDPEPCLPTSVVCSTFKPNSDFMPVRAVTTDELDWSKLVDYFLLLGYRQLQQPTACGGDVQLHIDYASSLVGHSSIEKYTNETMNRDVDFYTALTNFTDDPNLLISSTKTLMTAARDFCYSEASRNPEVLDVRTLMRVSRLLKPVLTKVMQATTPLPIMTGSGWYVASSPSKNKVSSELDKMKSIMFILNNTVFFSKKLNVVVRMEENVLVKKPLSRNSLGRSTALIVCLDLDEEGISLLSEDLNELVIYSKPDLDDFEASTIRRLHYATSGSTLLPSDVFNSEDKDGCSLLTVDLDYGEYSDKLDGIELCVRLKKVAVEFNYPCSSNPTVRNNPTGLERSIFSTTHFITLLVAGYSALSSNYS